MFFNTALWKLLRILANAMRPEQFALRVAYDDPHIGPVTVTIYHWLVNNLLYIIDFFTAILFNANLCIYLIQKHIILLPRNISINLKKILCFYQELNRESCHI